jgi:hypothetical protein
MVESAREALCATARMALAEPGSRSSRPVLRRRAGPAADGRLGSRLRASRMDRGGLPSDFAPVPAACCLDAARHQRGIRGPGNPLRTDSRPPEAHRRGRSTRRHLLNVREVEQAPNWTMTPGRRAIHHPEPLRHASRAQAAAIHEVQAAQIDRDLSWRLNQSITAASHAAVARSSSPSNTITGSRSSPPGG